MKQKVNNTKRVQVNVRGFEQILHVHYNLDTKLSPVTTMVTICFFFAQWASCLRWASVMLDVKGTFLKGLFQAHEKPIVMEVPQTQGFQHV